MSSEQITNISHCKGSQEQTGLRNHKDGPLAKDLFRNWAYKISHTDQTLRNLISRSLKQEIKRVLSSPSIPLNFLDLQIISTFIINTIVHPNSVHFSPIYIFHTISKLCLLEPIKTITLVRMSLSYCLLWRRMWFEEPFIPGLPRGQRLSANTLLQ